jgi:hypothetical protein
MTEPRGAGAHWGAAVVVAPATAALLAVATGWALEHDPSPQPAAAAAPAAPVARTGDDHPQRAALTLQQRAEAERAYVVTLHRRLARLHAQLAAVRRAPVPSVPSGGGAAVPAPPRAAAAPAPAPAPATHTSTGAS